MRKKIINDGGRNVPLLKEQVIEVKYSRGERNFSIEAVSPADYEEDGKEGYKLYIHNVDRGNGVYYKVIFSSVTEARAQIIDFLTNK